MTRKKLIEVALPLDSINAESSREKSIRHGHPSTMHLWWARRPLAACRAVLFTSLVDDPEQPDAPKELLEAIDRLLPDASGERSRRERLFDFISELVKWENTTNEHVLDIARELIRAATGGNPPPVLDPFCGGGSIPLEAQRLGLEAYASDLNPVAVLITKALVEIPPKFAGRPSVNPDARAQMGQGTAWKGGAGLAADVRWYGKWMRDRAWERIGHLYPNGPNGEMVIAWLWARTVKCPNPACGARMPLASSFWLTKKPGHESWVDPIVDQATNGVRFEVRNGKPPNETAVNKGTKTARGAKFFCLACGEPSEDRHIKDEGMASRMGAQLMAVVAEGHRSRTYISADSVGVPNVLPPEDIGGLDGEIADDPRNIWCKQYGLTTWGSLFTPRQLATLTTFSDLVGEARELVLTHALEANFSNDGRGIADGGTGATAYADAVATYLGISVSKLTVFHNSMARWRPGEGKSAPAFGRQAIPMVWDFAEVNPFAGAGGDWIGVVNGTASVLERIIGLKLAQVSQLDAAAGLPAAPSAMVFTDPPYYDNISYADLSDFFYVWLRRMLAHIHPDLFSTLLTPKAQELVATPYRYNGSRDAADLHFEEGLTKAFALIRGQASPAYPTTLYYAFKQAEEHGNGDGTAALASTGWQTMLEGLLRTGFQVMGTWPSRTEGATRLIAMDTNALASSIVLVCRPRPAYAAIATRREFLAALREELPASLRVLTGHGVTHPVSPVDLAQATIGPGMAVFSRYSKVIEASGDAMSVRTALQLINQAIDDYFTVVEGELDSDTRFCVAWFSEFGFDSGSFGQADVLARAKDVGIAALARDGVLESGANKVRLLPLTRYSDGWESYDPAADRRPTIWEACHYLVAAVMDTSGAGGEIAAARLVRRLGGLADGARDLAYRLYSICERQGWAEPALGYNALVASWPEIQKQAAALARETQAGLI